MLKIPFVDILKFFLCGPVCGSEKHAGYDGKISTRTKIYTQETGKIHAKKEGN